RTEHLVELPCKRVALVLVDRTAFDQVIERVRHAVLVEGRELRLDRRVLHGLAENTDQILQAAFVQPGLLPQHGFEIGNDLGANRRVFAFPRCLNLFLPGRAHDRSLLQRYRHRRSLFSDWSARWSSHEGLPVERNAWERLEFECTGLSMPCN